MKKITVFILLVSLLSLPFFATAKKTAGLINMGEPMISYALDIAPIIQARCTPCHFPKGKEKKLNSYAAVTSQINDILYRIQLPTDDEEFMPFKSKKEPLSDSLIQVFQLWKTQQMPK